MAGEGKTIEKLFIELGLDLSKLQSDILAADKTVTENLGRINREKSIIKLRMEADIAGLDRLKDATKILEIQERALNQQLTLSRDKLAILEAAYKQVASNANSTAVAVNRAEQAFLREKIAVANLESELKVLAAQKNVAPNNKLLSGYMNLKGDVVARLNEITSAFSNLQTATSSADSAITAALGVIGTIPHPVGRAVAALASLPIVLKGVENSIIDMTKAAAATGDSIYVMSRGFQMSIADTGKFTAMCKTAGVEVNDLASTIRRTQQQIVRGGEDAKGEKWLRRYGESAFDASGHLKNLNDMTLTLNRALKRAQAEGNGMAFILGTMRTASADAITAIEDAEDVYKQAATVVKNGLIDPKFAHDVQGKLNEMNLQAGQMNATFSAALLPVANEIVPKLTERMGNLTKIIADNKDVIRDFGRSFADAFLKIESAAESALGAVGKIFKAYHDWKKDPYQDKLVEKYKENFDIENVDDLIKAEQPRSYDIIKSNTNLYAQVRSMYEPVFVAIKDAQEEIRRAKEDLEKEINKPLSIANASAIGQERRIIEQNNEILESLRRARKYQEEADAIFYKMSHNDYENKRLDVDTWWNQLVREAENSNAELEALAKLREAKLAQIEKEQADQIAKAHEEATKKIQEHWKNAADIEYEMTHTAFEKQIRDIEQWKKAQLEKRAVGEETADILAEAAAKEAQAFEREMDRIKGTIQSLEDKIFEQEHSRYENDMRRVQQQRLKYYEEYQSKGILNADTQAIIERWFSNEIGSLNKRAAESRKSGGDYTKAPDGRSNILSIPLLADENRARQQMIQHLDKDARTTLEAIESKKNLIDAERGLVNQLNDFSMPSNFSNLLPQFSGATVGDTTIIHGDEVNQISRTDLKAEIEKALAGIYQMPDISQFGVSSMPDISQLVQSPTMNLETIVTPLNNINTVVGNILSAMGDRQPPNITVSPNISVNLGGAYVFDNAMKTELTNDITQDIVDEITATVQQATRQADYSYRA